MRFHARHVMAQLDAVFAGVRDEDPATGFGRLLKQIVVVLDTPRTISLLRMLNYGFEAVKNSVDKPLFGLPKSSQVKPIEQGFALLASGNTPRRGR